MLLTSATSRPRDRGQVGDVARLAGAHLVDRELARLPAHRSPPAAGRSRCCDCRDWHRRLAPRSDVRRIASSMVLTLVLPLLPVIASTRGAARRAAWPRRSRPAHARCRRPRPAAASRRARATPAPRRSRRARPRRRRCRGHRSARRLQRDEQAVPVAAATCGYRCTTASIGACRRRAGAAGPLRDPAPAGARFMAAPPRRVRAPAPGHSARRPRCRRRHGARR